MRDLFEWIKAPLAFWAVFVLAHLASSGWGELRLGPDDLARLAQVDALLTGQGWWDLTAYRLGVDGVAMHWTRHVDALFLAAGGGMAAMRTFALIAVPLLLALVVFVLVGRIADRLGGRRAVPAALLLLLASALSGAQFAPGRIDHHGLQIALVLLSVLGVLRFEQLGWAILSGAALGLSLSIGLEQALPAVGVMAAVGVVVAFERPDPATSDGFAGGLVGGAVLGSLLFAPLDRLLVIACDVFSLPHLVALVGASVTLVASSRVRRPLIVLVLGWVVSGAATLGLAPRCIDPYADVAPLLREHWLANVSEAQSLLDAVALRPDFGYAVLIPAVISVGFALWMWRSDGWRASGWGRMALVVALAFAGSLLQIRAASTATALGAVSLGVMFALLMDRLGKWPMFARVGTMTVVALIISGLAPLVLLAPPTEVARASDDATAACSETLQSLELQGVVLAPIDLGSPLLAYTDAQVVAGPYHRNDEGNLMAWELLATEAGVVDLRGIDYVAFCRGMFEIELIERVLGPGLLTDLSNGSVPQRLEPLTPSSEALQVFAVRG